MSFFKISFISFFLSTINGYIKSIIGNSWYFPITEKPAFLHISSKLLCVKKFRCALGLIVGVFTPNNSYALLNKLGIKKNILLFFFKNLLQTLRNLTGFLTCSITPHNAKKILKWTPKYSLEKGLRLINNYFNKLDA